MATFSKVKLSESTSGKEVKVAATATPGTAIHTAVAGASDIDEIWIYATNKSAQDVVLTLEWGAAAPATDYGIGPITVKAGMGLLLIAPGLILNGGLVVSAFASVASVIGVHGYVNRITA